MPQTDSSPGTEVVEESTTEIDSQDVNNAEPSSSSEEGVESTSFLDVVEAALESKGEASPASEEEGDEQQDAADAASEDGEEGQESDDAEITEDEFKALSEKTQKRIRGLVAERDEIKRETEDLKGRAEQWDRVVGYMQDNNIQPSEVDNALQITRLINTGDYSKALQALTPIYRELATLAGEILPKDLAEEVRLGRISEQHARELNRSRASANAAEYRETQSREQRERQQQQTTAQQVIGTAIETADTWAKSKASSDPDWSEKHEDVAEQFELELSRLGPGNFPKTRQEVIDLAETALSKVEKRIKRFKPKPQERREATGHGASPKAKAKPKSYEEAIDQALYG